MRKGSSCAGRSRGCLSVWPGPRSSCRVPGGRGRDHADSGSPWTGSGRLASPGPGRDRRNRSRHAARLIEGKGETTPCGCGSLPRRQLHCSWVAARQREAGNRAAPRADGRGVGRPAPRSCACARVAARRRAQPAARNEDGSPREAAAAVEYVAELGITVTPLSHGTDLIAAAAEAAWLPARTAAEHLDPASFRSVTISAQPWQSRVMTRTFTRQADIAGLISIINAGAPAPLSVVTGMHCAPVAIVYILRFTPRAAGGPSVVLALGGCPHSYGITVNGRQQPSLWDNGKLRTAAGTLLGIRYPLGA